MPQKCTLLFQLGTGSAAGSTTQPTHLGGWSESIYYFSDDAASFRDRVLTNGAWGTGLCQARAALLPSSARIVGQRFARVLPRTGRSQTLKQQFPGTSGELCDVPQMAIQCSIPAQSAINVRRFTLRGIPDNQVSRGELSPTAGFLSALDTYRNSLGNFNFPGQDQTILFKGVISISDTGLVQFSEDPLLAINNLVQFRGLRDIDENVFNAYAYVAALGPGLNQVTLRNWTLGATWGGMGRRYLVSVYLMDPTRFTIERVVVRKVGRPFEQYRGRRSKARVR